MSSSSKTFHGNKPPVESLSHARALLTAHHAAETGRRAAQRAEAGRTQDRFRHLLFDSLKSSDEVLRQITAERRETIDRMNKEVRRSRPEHAGLSVMDQKSNASGKFDLRTPPYDFDWKSGSGQGLERADHTAGTYGLDVQTIGNGELAVAAGVGFWFFSGDGASMQRFAAVADYFFDWWDGASGYVAHNDGRTHLWVFGHSEGDWVARSDQTPSWSDGVGWFESHGNHPGEDGRVSGDTFFNARPQSWYQCWIWSSADVYGDGGFWGFADSTIHITMSVPFAVMGSLF